MGFYMLCSAELQTTWALIPDVTTVSQKQAGRAAFPWGALQGPTSHLFPTWENQMCNLGI